MKFFNPNRAIAEEHGGQTINNIFPTWFTFLRSIPKSDEVQIMRETVQSNPLTQMSTEIFIPTNIAGQTSIEIQNGYSVNRRNNIEYEFLVLNNP